MFWNQWKFKLINYGEQQEDYSGKYEKSQDRESFYQIINKNRFPQDSSSCKFTIKIDNFTPEFGEKDEPINYNIGDEADDSDNNQIMQW